jgi:hypothetical protein
VPTAPAGPTLRWRFRFSNLGGLAVISIQRNLIAAAAAATLALAAAPAARAADPGQDGWWYNSRQTNWQSANDWRANGDGWRYRNSRTDDSSYRYAGGRPYYYAPPPAYYYVPAHVDPPIASFRFTF